MEGIDFTAGFIALGTALTGIVGLGAWISKFTKTDKDDKFFARAGEALKNIFKRSA